jgi:hypothetical protein
MTELEWVTTVNVDGMLVFAGPRMEARLLRQFALACVERVERLLGDEADEAYRQLIALAEGDAEEEIGSVNPLSGARSAANYAALARACSGEPGRRAADAAALSAVRAFSSDQRERILKVLAATEPEGDALMEEQHWQANRLRDLVKPFPKARKAG